MKRFLSVVLSVTVMIMLLSACGTEKKPEYPETHSLFFKDSNKSSKATATFFNSVNGKSENVEMKKISEDSGSINFS